VLGGGFPGSRAVDIGVNGLSLYSSSGQTWPTFGVFDKAWYSQLG
jgi:hypothetical protein